MLQTAPNGSYSSTVKLKLIADGCDYELADIAPDSICLRTPVSLAPCNARVLMTVDGHERIWNVSLPDGADASNRLVRVRLL